MVGLDNFSKTVDPKTGIFRIGVKMWRRVPDAQMTLEVNTINRC